MPGYDPVRDAGGSDRSSPSTNHHYENGSRPSPSSSTHAQHSSTDADGIVAPRRSLSGNSLDRYGEPYGSYAHHNMHDTSARPVIISPRSSSSALPPQAREQSRYSEHEYAVRRYNQSPSNSLQAKTSQPPRRGASIADLVAVSEMSEAEHDRHRGTHRWPAHYGEEHATNHSMSRSSSASGGFQGSSATIPHSSSYPRISPQIPCQTGRSERSPSMAHLLNDGTAGAIQDRPRSSSHSSVSSHVSHQPPQHHPSQMSPLGYPSSYAGPGPAAHARDRSAGSITAAGGSGAYWVSSPTSAHPPNMHAQNFSTLNRGASSPGLGPSHVGHPVERARYASHAGSTGHGALPRSGSNSYAYTSASSSPASNPHAHLQPSPSHCFAVPEVPLTRSPESRRVPLPQSPTSAHNAHPRASLSQGVQPIWGGDEHEASSTAGMPPPSMNASPRRGSLANSMNVMQRPSPTTPGNGVPPTPGSANAYSGYPVTPGSRSLPPHTPTAAYPRHAGEGYEESNYFPRMDAHASSSYGHARERSTSLTSPHLRQLEHPSHGAADYEPTSDTHCGYSNASATIRTPGSGYHTSVTGRSSMQPPPSFSPSAMSPSFGPQRGGHVLTEEKELGVPIGRAPAYKAAPTFNAEYVREESEEQFRQARHASRDLREDEATSQHSQYQASGMRDARMSIDRQISPVDPTSRQAPAVASPNRDFADEHREQQRSREHSTASNRSAEHLAEIDNKAHIDSTKEQAEVKSEAADAVPPLPRYAPSNRVSQPRQVMLPIGIEEIDRKRARCRNPLRREWEQLHQADSRETLDEILRDFHTKLARTAAGQSATNGGDKSSSDGKKRAIGETLIDGEEVADHYNKRREVGIHGREESPIIALRKFNNWIKSVLVGTFARGRDPTLDGRTRARGGRILDLGCGKGGDLKKWEKVRPSGLVGADIAAISIEQAIARHRDNKSGYPGDFFAFDCFSMKLTEVIPRELLEPLFDNVSLQFCMHYAWEDTQKARVMLDNVSRYLRKGGVFVGTIPDSRELRDRMDSSAHPEDRSFGNRYYKVAFDQIDSWPAFGNRYTFFLEDAVENVPEYVVDFDVFEELAHEVGLRCIYRKNFAEIYHEGARNQEHGKLLEKMRVVDRYGALNLDEEMWQAATLYLGFAFEKM
ncbi:related to RNA (guanine-N7-) methyltransferase [Melanopsichium pennsylvanicum]|uniref:mRNA cap guanine-N(7) methyltransferase n=2 Tax=Melanopsichium pennsylvanicum TaxID=63383 RepID=A0AAJ5C6A2_9BASI|nr:related to RNA (guanine-N7-) methyltransferase [Melanopsichium pennsylvanicum 4]SNX85622.1 related to RNA (guanine-N7-) methyltransferase [Melanopsichium pennsylvanicum]